MINNTTKTISAKLSTTGKFMIGYADKNLSLKFTNLSGSSLREIFEKEYIEKDENTIVNEYVYNIAQRILDDYKSIEILPKNSDIYGTSYSGDYTIKVVELADTQKMYYTMSPIDQIGLVEDSVGKKHLSNDEDFSNENKWHEVHVNDIIPTNATAIATSIPEISAVSDINYKLQFIPNGNTYGNKYYFQIVGSSDNLENAISSEVKVLNVVDRKISGIVFFDANRDGKYNSGDTLLANKKVYLYDEEDNLVREMTTDSNGYYEGERFDRGNYYIKYIPEEGQEFVTKNAGAANISSVVNPDGTSDIIQEFAQNPTSELMYAQNMNVGLQYKPVHIKVYHLKHNGEGLERVHDDVDITDKLFNDEYHTEAIDTNDLYEAYKGLYRAIDYTDGDLKNGRADKEFIEVIYYYDLNPVKVKVHHYLVGTEEKVHDDDEYEFGFNEHFKINPYATEALDSPYNVIYEYKEAAGDPSEADATQLSYEVIFYYGKKQGKVVTHYCIKGHECNDAAPYYQVHDDDERYWDYNEEYSTRSYDTTNLYEDYRGVYYPTGTFDERTPVSGVVTKNRYDVTYYYDKQVANILVHHYIIGTETKVYKDERYTVEFGKTYKTKYLESSALDEGYRNMYFYNSSEGDDPEGPVEKDSYEITYYYGIKNATITVHHYLEGTTTKVHEDDEISKMFFEGYTTSAYPSVALADEYKGKYEYKGKNGGDGVSGNVGKTEYEVIYYYELKDVEIITHYYILGTEDKVHDSKIMYKKMTESYETRPLETEELYTRYRNVYVYSNEYSGETSGIVDKDKYIIIYYYIPRTATITVHHYEISKDGNRTTNRVQVDDVITKNFTERYETRALNSEELSGNYKGNYYYHNEWTGTREGYVTTDNIEVTYYYEAKPSRITVHHYIIGTETKVHADDIINKKYTDSYETRALSTEELIGDYQNNYYYNGSYVGELSGTVSEDSYEIIYYYELRPSKITVHHYVKGTTNKVHGDDIITDIKYTEAYNITPYEPSELTGTYQNNYYYNGEHTGDELAGKVSKDEYEITIYYEARPSVVIVHHYVLDTINKVHEDDVIEKHYGESYSTKNYETGELDNPYKNVYSYSNTTSGDNVSGTIDKDNYEVIYYYDYRPSTLTVHHYIVGTETRVHDDDTYEMRFMEIYQTNPRDTEELYPEYSNWYEYKEIKAGDQPNGTIIGDSYEVTYYYDKMDAKLTVHHYVIDTETEIAEDEIINLKLRDHYETQAKADNELNRLNYTFDIVVGEASGNINEKEREVVYYYKLKEAQLIVHHLAEDTGVKLCPDEIEDVTYQDFYTVDSCTELSDINYTYKEVVTNDNMSEQRGTKIMGNILQDTVEVTYYYELKPGQIIVYYFEVGTRERVAEDVISNGQASKEFISEAKEIEGYTLVSKPESNVHIYEEDTQEVIYEYERNKYYIGVEVTGGVGNITGAEEVLYGYDSTEDNIIITPSEGYEIEDVTVDGESIEIKDKKGFVLENFKSVSKDHKVEVSFKEEEIPVPITGINKKIITAILLILSMGIIYLSLKSSLKNKYNN